MRAKHVVILIGGGFILAGGVFALRVARETAVWACIVSIHQGVQNLNLSEKDFPDARSEWSVLSESDSGRIILAASKIHSFDCSRVKSSEPHFDYWGRPLQIGVRKTPEGELEFRVWSKGRDGESGTSDDLVSPWGEKAISSK
jgi:hypothetical protein